MTNAPVTMPQSDDDLFEKLKGLERFIARRFDEISMEINATAQQLDMAEGGISGKFSEVLSVLSAVSHQNTNTQANAGIELETVIEETDKATNTILDAATAIASKLEGPVDDAAKIEIFDQVNTIIMACSFQDLTSQRIRKALFNIQTAEETLSGTLEKLGIEVENTSEQFIAAERPTSSQADIDALFD